MSFHETESVVSLTLSQFDFTANSFSRDFESFATSTEEFAKYFSGDERPRMEQAVSYPDLVLCDTPDSATSSTASSPAETIQPAKDDERKGGKKRSALVLPEVDSPPSFVKKSKNCDAGASKGKALTDSEFQLMVGEKYLISEGMS